MDSMVKQGYARRTRRGWYLAVGPAAPVVAAAGPALARLRQNLLPPVTGLSENAAELGRKAAELIALSGDLVKVAEATRDAARLCERKAVAFDRVAEYIAAEKTPEEVLLQVESGEVFKKR